MERMSKGAGLWFTLKAWPVITAVTIGLCYLTQLGAKLFGVELPEQANVDIIRRMAGWNASFILNVVLILLVLPAVEELLFRWLLWRLPLRFWARLWIPFAVASSALFSSAHYLAQPWPDNAFLALFLFGFAQCGLYRKTGRIICPMLNHALFNLTNLALLFVIPAPGGAA